MQELRALVEEVLFGRRMERVGCFASNAAARDLRAAPENALAVIEQVLREMVFPEIVGYPRANRETERMLGISILEKYPSRFIGLLDVMDAYLLIGVRGNSIRLVAFLETLPENLILPVLNAISNTASPGDAEEALPLTTSIKEWLISLRRHPSAEISGSAGALSALASDVS